MKRAKAKKPPGTRCSNCGRVVPDYDVINLVSRDKSTRELCGRCFNTEMAQASGLEKFQHLDFEPVRIVDCEGKQHDFHFRTHLFGLGVSLDAFELRDGEAAGYKFQVIGEPEEDLLALLGRLVEKIRRALAVKYLKRTDMGLQIAEMRAQGRFGWDEYGDGVPLVVIDGKEITWDHFGRMMMSFEGWQFKLEIFDKSEEA